MSKITFTNNYIITKATSSVDYLDLGFTGADKLENDKTTTSAVTGASQRAVAHFKNNSPPPKTFSMDKEVKFPDGTQLTISGGGPNDDVIEAVDINNNRAVWLAV